MILELLIRLFFGLGNMLLSLIPTISLPDGFFNVIADISYFFSMANYFLPVQTILICFSIIFLVDNIKLIMSILNWLISKIPTIS